jgi:tRNA pseudouridine(38-40) synthase
MSESASSESTDNLKKRNIALWFGYAGTEFRGSQVLEPRRRQPVATAANEAGSGDRAVDLRDGTVEGELAQALYRIGAVTELNFMKLSKICWSRASRTDKGVHAVANVVSAKLLLDLRRDLTSDEELTDLFVDRLNAQLPPNIRVFGGQRMSKGFRARSACTLREYDYLLPRWVLDGREDVFLQALRCFEGTHRFHNFSGKERRIQGRGKQTSHDALAKVLNGDMDGADDDNDDDVDDEDGDDDEDEAIDCDRDDHHESRSDGAEADASTRTWMNATAGEQCERDDDEKGRASLHRFRDDRAQGFFGTTSPAAHYRSGSGASVQAAAAKRNRSDLQGNEQEQSDADGSSHGPVPHHESESQNGHGNNASAQGEMEGTMQARTTTRPPSRFQQELDIAKQVIQEIHPDKERAPIEHDDARCVQLEAREPFRRMVQVAYPVAHLDRLRRPYYLRTLYRFHVEPFLSRDDHGCDFLLVRVRGQSFVLHQIRRLIGAGILVARGHLSLEALEAALEGPYRVVFWRAPGSCLMLYQPSFWDPRRRLFRLVPSPRIKARMQRFRQETLIPQVCAIGQLEWKAFLDPAQGAKVVYCHQEQLVEQYRLWRERVTAAAEERRHQSMPTDPQKAHRAGSTVELPRGIQTTMAIHFNLLPGPELARLRQELQAAAENGKLPRQPSTVECLAYCERLYTDRAVDIQGVACVE